ncbi:MAG: D-aminoacyl-tRNA deacylase [Cellvibrionales bacterium]|nr:D-aminoacyl-tRNA deacylase [Cellvibrionales bacterium]
MRALLQRVQHASVCVDGKTVGAIEQGLLVFLGVGKDDDVIKTHKMIEKILKYRVFSDADDKMNLSLKDIQGGLLIVSQFTLQAETAKGLRPSFTPAAEPKTAKLLYDEAIVFAKQHYSEDLVQTGEFAADMQISIVNDGPVTFLLE